LKSPTEPRHMTVTVQLTVVTMGCIEQSTLASVDGRAATDNLGRNINLFEGGVQASATAAAGVISDATTSVALESSTDHLAGQQPPALLPRGPKPRSNPTEKGRPSNGAPIRHMTPEARSGDPADRADLNPVAQELASTMESADGRKYLILLRLQQQARSTGDDRMALMMADVYLQQIVAIIGNQVSGGSGSSAGSSSGAWGRPQFFPTLQAIRNCLAERGNRS
jgi:hypothetical protein